MVLETWRNLRSNGSLEELAECKQSYELEAINSAVDALHRGVPSFTCRQSHFASGYKDQVDGQPLLVMCCLEVMSLPGPFLPESRKYSSSATLWQERVGRPLC